MGTKLNPGAFDCYANALPDEPFFVLLARDPLAPGLVTDWAMRYFEGLTIEEKGKAADKFVEAAQCAIAMKAWREANPKPEGGYPKPPTAIYVSEQQGRKIYDKLRYALGITQFTGHSIMLIRQAVNEVLNEGADKSSAPADAATVKDYEDATNSFLAHVRDLDVAMNGENGAAKRPLIIDIKAQLLAYIGLGNCAALAVERYEKALADRRDGEVAASEFVQMVTAEVKANHGHVTAPVEMGK